MLSTESNEKKEVSKVALVVLGMHRSGTSALTHALSTLGAELPGDPIPKLEFNNPEGFWESTEVLGVNEALLQGIDSNWDDWFKADLNKLSGESLASLQERAQNAVRDSYRDASLIAVKDPRICRVFPFWKQILLSCGYKIAPVLIVRNPIEVARSLSARDQFSTQKSIALWLRHVLDSEIDTRHMNRSIVTFDQLITNPLATLGGIAAALDLPETKLQRNYQANPVMKSDQRHHTARPDELGLQKVTCGWAQDVFLTLARQAKDQVGASDLGKLDSIRANFEASLDILGPLTKTATEIEQKARLSDKASTSIAHGTHRLQGIHSRLVETSRASNHFTLQLKNANDTIQRCTQQVNSQIHRTKRLEMLANAGRAQLSTTRQVLERAPAILAHGGSRLFRLGCFIQTVLALRGPRKNGRWLENIRLVYLMVRHNLFDQAWYMTRYQVPGSRYAALLAHWLNAGWKDGHSPCPEFDTEFYIQANEDVRQRGHNPLFHYLLHGAREHRSCGFYFDAAWYARTNPDVPGGAAKALVHFRQHGRHEGRQPNVLFNPRHYQFQRPRVGFEDCLTDYILVGSLAGLTPSPSFQPNAYRRKILLRQPADIEPLGHCLQTWCALDANGRLKFEISGELKRLLGPASSNFRAASVQQRKPLPDMQAAEVENCEALATEATDIKFRNSDQDRVSAAIEQTRFFAACVATLKSMIPRRSQPKLRLSLLRHNLKLTSSDFGKVRAAFDSDYYLASYPELATVDCPLVEHYLRNGWREGRNPAANFNTSYYLQHNPDIVRPDINPFVHWVLHGRAERRPAITHRTRLSAQHYQPLVTCIVPNFNHEQFLRKRLESILDQTYSRIELIILDDCSTDGSRSVIEEYARNHPDTIKTVYNDTGSGSVFSQWQKGTALATGELTWICESDDYCEPDFLENLVPLFNDRSVQLAFGRIQFCDKDGAPYPGLDTYREQAEPGIWANTLVRPACRWFRGAFGVRNIIPNVGGCVWRTQTLPRQVWENALDYKVAGDWYLYSMLAAGGQVAWNPNAVAYFRQHRTNTSVTAFKSDRYYREHHMLMASLQAQWGLPLQSVSAFHHHLHQHSLAIGGDDALKKLDRYVPLSKLASMPRTSQHVLIAFLGFHPGGGEFFPIRLANSLHSRGIRVSLLALDMGRVNKSMLSSVATGIPVYDAAYLSEYGVDRFLEDAGITLIHSHMISVEWYFFGKERIQTQLPYVVTMHGSYESSPLRGEKLGELVKNVTRWIYLADKNLVPLEGFNIPGDKLVKLPNAVPIDERPFPQSRQELGIEENALVFTLVARGIPNKGWRTAIHAFRELSQRGIPRPAHLILAGEGKYVDDLEKAHSHVAGIHFLGFQSCIQGLYRISDVALVPTRFEGESFPLCIIEAFQAGIPVIATRIGEIPDMITPRGAQPAGLLVDPERNSNAFIGKVHSAMLSMLRDSLREKLRQGAQALAKTYDMDVLTARYEEAYEAAMVEHSCNNEHRYQPELQTAQ